jgi:hypothetical protein
VDVRLAVARKEVIKVAAEMLTKNGQTASAPIPATAAPEDELREWVRQHVERVRRLTLHIAWFLLGMVVLTPVWALVEWQTNGGFERWSENSNPRDWEPWLLYIGLAWGLWVAFVALRADFDRPTTEAEIEREVRRLRSRD